MRLLRAALPPAWATLIALAAASALIIAVGGAPLAVYRLLLAGTWGNGYGIGQVLFKTTPLIFTGLAVSLALRAGLFNIGAEGQAYIGGLGAGLLCLFLGGTVPFSVIVLLGIAVSALFGGAWAYIPAYLQAKRGSHIVITTIMFNFIAAALMTYLLVNVLIRPGQQAPESREFSAECSVLGRGTEPVRILPARARSWRREDDSHALLFHARRQDRGRGDPENRPGRRPDRASQEAVQRKGAPRL